MAEFCVRQACKEIPDDRKINVDIHSSNSLKNDEWPRSDIVLMNPPFRAWESLSDDERIQVSKILSPTSEIAKGIGRPDVAFAFVKKALASLAPGGVMASLVPASFLHSHGAKYLRELLVDHGEFKLRMIALFKGWKYFGDATVEPVVIIASRSKTPHATRILVAQHGSEERAIRALRAEPWNETIEAPGFELYNVDSDELSSVNLTPKPQRVRRLMRAVEATTHSRVGDSFIARLGVRVGSKPVFIVPRAEFLARYHQLPESRFFRPIADRIVMGQIQPSVFLFYPYSTDGELLLTSEKALRESAPVFYQSNLKTAREKLQARGSLRNRKWWEVSEPVKTWLASYTPRIVCQEFGRKGNFGLDVSGTYAVVQGHGWEWIGAKKASPNRLYAYLAILNSQFFDTLLEGYCPRLQGGQYVLRRQFIENVPLPILNEVRLIDNLHAIGRLIHTGDDYSESYLETLVQYAYQVDLSKIGIQEDIEAEFYQLAERWEAETGFYSFMEQRTAHPLYQQIVAFGDRVVIWLLRELKNNPSAWSIALQHITGDDPVPDTVESQREVVDYWLKWGHEHGYDV
jgi:hypothetical protein